MNLAAGQGVKCRLIFCLLITYYSVLNGQLFSTAQNIRRDILNILLINKHQMTKHGTTVLKRIVSRLFNDGELMLTNVEDGVNLLGPWPHLPPLPLQPPHSLLPPLRPHFTWFWNKYLRIIYVVAIQCICYIKNSSQSSQINLFSLGLLLLSFLSLLASPSLLLNNDTTLGLVF